MKTSRHLEKDLLSQYNQLLNAISGTDVFNTTANSKHERHVKCYHNSSFAVHEAIRCCWDEAMKFVSLAHVHGLCQRQPSRIRTQASVPSWRFLFIRRSFWFRPSRSTPISRFCMSLGSAVVVILGTRPVTGPSSVEGSPMPSDLTLV